MDLKRLRTFVVVAEQGTVSNAAKTLRITQPALSRQLQDLQAEFGVALFDQVGRRLRLTAEGAELVPACRSLLGQADGLLEHARSLAQGDSGELNVGAQAHLIASVFSGFLREFAAKYPRVHVRTVEAGSVDQLEFLRRGGRARQRFSRPVPAPIRRNAIGAILQETGCGFLIRANQQARLRLAIWPLRFYVSLGLRSMAW